MNLRSLKVVLAQFILFQTSAFQKQIYTNGITTINLSGQLRAAYEKSSHEINSEYFYKDGKKTSPIYNDYSRINLTVTHRLRNNFYALGSTQVRFDKTDKDSKIGNLYQRYLYLGIGHLNYGEILIGKQQTPLNELGITDIQYNYQIFPTYLPTTSEQSIKYNYRKNKNLIVSAYFGSDENKRKESKIHSWGTSAEYQYKLSSDYKLLFEGYLGRSIEKSDIYTDVTNQYLVGVGLNHKNYELGLNVGRALSRGTDEYIQNNLFTSVSLKYNLDNKSVYYIYTKEKQKVQSFDYRADINGYYYLAGFQYKFSPTVITYVEYTKQKYNNMDQFRIFDFRETEKRIVTGLRINF